ncbi:YbaK/EbsC family protein [Microcella frigidaquae]|uniref:Prolyl-tRNA editing enzyme YbaK/EbsC (Cys-tRNA(Pro) deacylase) n=1 Tax=Microcella frigidaquae TaxID=424758 RepID=A0A840X314_9MICO|nr:YbaK/EbsC family protein [Microcella frigidaquae]MBB5616760.1 prolyl-tRNA editing enzyme YbaK/EbsC (Cys-tRNA(Pro) deacylase) [Microcella frigidaquae]NHN43798.1 YbaK/EbsC family protein [Microcella frigidaquae]
MASGPERFLQATAHLPITPQRMPDSTHTAAEAAAAVGVEVGAIVKSLVFVVVHDDDRREPVLALVCGGNRADLDALAAVLGGRIEKADATTVKAATGYSIGGVPPLGHPAPVRTVIDRDLLRFDTVWSAAGSAYDVFPASPQQLVAWTGGELADIGTR